MDSALDVCADLTDEEIVRQVLEPDSESDSEDDAPAIVRPSNAELTEALMVLSSVFSDRTTLAKMQNDRIARRRNTVQQTIDRFLEPLDCKSDIPVSPSLQAVLLAFAHPASFLPQLLLHTPQ
ncbi:hypothetical protein HPB47_013710 [Ixodes persulcatus]|uniref:Uncharacterized protein n=1 Tax=Ixodes persulcatus TaxID=34615 RepID=A0AC60QZ74_IXOPE|nr:hypothetical protein HPB47_013710 [Ixodes persulcatus]